MCLPPQTPPHGISGRRAALVLLQPSIATHGVHDTGNGLTTLQRADLAKMKFVDIARNTSAEGGALANY